MTKKGSEAGEALKRLHQQQQEQSGQATQGAGLGAGDAVPQQSLLGVSSPAVVQANPIQQQGVSGARSIQQFIVAVSQGQSVTVQNPPLGPRQQLLAHLAQNAQASAARSFPIPLSSRPVLSSTGLALTPLSSDQRVSSLTSDPRVTTLTLHSQAASGLRQQLAQGGPLVVVPPGGQRSQLTPLVLTQDANNELQIISSTQVPQVPVAVSTASPVRGTSTIHHLGQAPVRAAAVTQQVAAPCPAGARPQAPTQAQIRGLISQLQAHSSQVVQIQQATRVPTTAASGTTQTVTHSPMTTPERPRKKIKSEDEDVGVTRKRICDEKLKQMAHIKECYTEHLTELFFLQNGGNMMDYFPWKKRNTPQLQRFLKSGKLDSDEEDVDDKSIINNEVKVVASSGGATPVATPVAIATTLPPAVQSIQLQQQQGIAVDHRVGGRHGMVFGHVKLPSTSPLPPTMPGGIPLSTTAATTTVGSPPPYSASVTVTPTTVKTTIASTTLSTNVCLASATSTSSSTGASLISVDCKPSLSTPNAPHVSTYTVSTVTSITTPSVKTPTTPVTPAAKQPSISAVYDSAIGSQEAIVERAKQEAQVMQRIAELRKSGLWSARRLPKVQEPPRNKAHWDYLLEEMQWLAADFAQERKWKKAGCRKIARMISRYHQEQQQKEIKAEKEEGQRLVRIASSMGKMVKEFWSNIEKVVQYKQQSRLEEKRKKALDLHLSFIVDQTEKYSSWLTEGLARSGPGSTVSTSIGSPGPSSLAGDDGDFDPTKDDESDDEETIAKAEQEIGMDEERTKQELADLQAEGEMPIEELLKSLPQDVLDRPASINSGSDGEDASDSKKKDDGEFKSDAEESADDESTMIEAEKTEKVDHKAEIDDLKMESEMTVEELYKKYAGAYDSDFEAEISGDETESEEDASGESAVEESDEEEDQDEPDMEVGVEALMEEEPVPQAGPADYGNKEISDIAATAQSIQPTGYTLETTQVRTPVPFLLKHSLREYQHVGLDWLATMYVRKLNGILADEMGLGKTIQTIALLAHLACDHGIWGPHLIVVPTSVMLNWEMELKKWCPAFKILTYYGNQKERKMKRTGWTKTNAFHVCITSYKLVIQDHQSFRRKKWKYFILDEAQNIKNFKSQRWQTLLNFTSQRRLLLTGTPLQNSLMELWSLMHFLMPHVFQSHREFKEWFANPLSGMIEGSREYNENLIKRLHKVLRPFLLRRLKADVEKQMPKKYEHVVMCHLSKRQRYLYDDFMAQTKTKETLESGHFMSVINILMQLRKVCNHPNLFDPRPIVSPFQMEDIGLRTASLVLRALDKDPLEYIDPCSLYPNLAEMELKLPAYAAHRASKLATGKKLIEEIDSAPEPSPRPKPADKPTKFVFRSMSPLPSSSGRSSPFVPIPQRASSPLTVKPTVQTTKPETLVAVAAPTTSTQQVTTEATTSTVASVKPVVSVSTAATSILQAKVTPQLQSTVSTTATVAATTSAPAVSHVLTSQPITVQIHHTQQGTRLMIPSGQLSQLPGFIQIVQTSTGQQIIATSQPPTSSIAGQRVQTFINGPGLAAAAAGGGVPTNSTAAVTTTTTSYVVTGGIPSTSTVARASTTSSVQLPTSSGVSTTDKPVVRVSPMSTVAAGVVKQVATTSTVTGTPSLAHPQTVMASATKTMITTRSVNTKPTPKAVPSKEKSKFDLASLTAKRATARKNKLARMALVNTRNCCVAPVYGTDLIRVVSTMLDVSQMADKSSSTWNCRGYQHCQASQQRKEDKNHPDVYWKQTEALDQVIRNPEQRLANQKELLERFVFVCPKVTAPRVTLHTHHPPPSVLLGERRLEFCLKKEVSPKAVGLHPVSTRMAVQFPELRLIQYDCGKLQTLDLLLRRLKSGQHRVLVFTQMTRMLDILESFLNYHGHRYLRLDGTTKVEQRQALMERFNMDKRIFVFILSTRSGGIGVNLTGADTVIFYDSDWNPTMDAQAQDRCHRIGQTRDVHIYRLVSEQTVEENILKKANQKRLLGNVAIEGGNFTTAFFRGNTIQELFEKPTGLDKLAAEKQAEEEAKQSRQRAARAKALEVAETKKLSVFKSDTPEPAETPPEEELSQDQIEQALCAAEEETDMQAVQVVKAEQRAEVAEFDESIPWDEREEHLKKERDDEISRVEQELSLLDKELSSIERYAVTFIEGQLAPFSTEELQKAEEEVSIAKEEWELGRLKSLKEEEERRAELEEDEMLFTYSRDDAYNQVYISEDTGEHMPMWAPPTPPQDDNDLYIDNTLCFLYEPSTMPESQLPPVYIKKEHKRIRVDAVVRKPRLRKEELPRVPPSLFHRPRDQKIRQGMIKPFGKQLMPRQSDSGVEPPDWIIHEDWALLQAFQMLQELPLTLATKSPAHIANWDLIADVVNGCSRTYRSPKQCKNRYENVIVPREEGKILYDINPRNKKKSKGIYKTKNNRPMRTSQLYLQDTNNSVTHLFSHRFDAAKAVAGKKTPTIRPSIVNPTHGKNPKHAAVLLESGINYDLPLTPIRVAANRADRIALEKKKQQTQQAAAAERTSTTVAATAQTQATVTAQIATAAATATAQPGMTIVQGQSLPVVTAAAAGTTLVTTRPATVSAVSLTRTLGAGATGSIVVNAAGGVAGNTFATINKRMANQTVVASVAQPSATTSTSNIAQAVRAARTSTAPMTVQEITAAVVNHGQRVVTQTTSGHVITSQAQLVAAQKAGAVTVSSVAGGTVQQQLGAAATKTLTAAQIQILRQQAQIKQHQIQQQQRLKAVAQGTIAGTIQKTVAATPLITSVAQTSQLAQGARLQAPINKQAVKQTTVTRQMTEQELQLLMKRQQLYQQKLAAGQNPQVHQIQVTQGQVTRLTTAQLIGAQVQQVGASTSQPMATLVKTVSTPGSTVPSVTIPLSAVSLGLTVPHQKTTTKTLTPAQMRQIQLQQTNQQRQQRALLAQQQKLSGQLKQVTGGAGGPLLIPQGQPTKVMVQHIGQQLVKPQGSGGAQPTIQQIITSVAPTSTTVMPTQLVTSAQAAQTVAKMSLPSAALGQARAISTMSIPQNTTVVAGSSTPVAGVTHTIVSGAPNVTVPGQATLVKPDMIVSPQKTLSIAASGVIHQVKSVSGGVRQLPGVTVTQLQGASAGQPAHTVSVHPTGTATPPKQQTQQQQPSSGVQQAVQQVVQQAQAQAHQQRQQQQQQVVGGVPGSLTPSMTTPTTQGTIPQNVTVAVQQAPSTQQQQAMLQQIPGQSVATTQGLQGHQQAQDQQGKASPYAMRLRNQRQ